MSKGKPKEKYAKSVDETLESLPRNERVIVDRLRQLIKECLPKAEEKAYYGEGVPFYSHNRLICFIWPPSAYMGEKKPAHYAKGVTLGFCQGNRMSNDNNLLLKEGRKQVYCMYFKSLDEIDDQEIRSLLFEAELVDEGFRKKKRK